jgi:hypothetical protein
MKEQKFNFRNIDSVIISKCMLLLRIQADRKV